MAAVSICAQWLLREKNVGVISVLFCSFLFFSVLFSGSPSHAALASRLDGVTHTGGILTEALEKEKPTVGKNSDFSGNFAEGPKVSRRAV